MSTTQIHLTIDLIEFPTAEAAVDSVKLTLSNIQMLKNLITQSYNDLLLLRMEAGKETEYANSVAYLRGQVAAYSHLIAQHEQSYISGDN